MDFYERYKTYSNSQLLDIIEHPGDYQPDAVETAKAIIQNRKPTEDEMKIARNELDAVSDEKSRKEQQKKEVRDKLKSISQTVIDHINPVQDTFSSTQKKIRIISIVFGALYFLWIYKEFGMLHFMFTDRSAEWGFDMITYILPLIFIPTLVILFYKKKKAGWYLLMIHLVYSAISMIWLLHMSFKVRDLDVPGIDSIISTAPVIIYILAFLFFAGMIGVISQKDIRSVYAIKKQTAILTIIIITLVISLGIYLFAYKGA